MRWSNQQKPQRKKSPLRDRIRRLVRLVKWGGGLLIVLGIAGAWYTHRLSRFAEQQFSRSFRWDIPSKIYSDVEYLFPGLDIKRRRLQEKLDRLGYRNTGDGIHSPGDYAMRPNGIEIFLHHFDYPLQKFEGFPVRIAVSGSVIDHIGRIDSGERIATMRLEPELIATLFDDTMEDRSLVTLQEVPDACLQSIILVEDERFFRHHGIDPKGIARAFFANVRALRIAQGGSTLTQQLVKNYFLDSERSFQRKIKEAIIALIIEQKHSKGEILEAYLNEIYLGQRGASSVFGFGEAARLYFAKEARQLTAGECALLAGMIRAPNRYSPFRDKDAAAQRRNFVLNRLHEAALVDDTVYHSAITEPLILPKQRERLTNAPYFIDFVRTQLRELYPDTQLSAEGLRIFTTLDMTNQLIAEQAVSNGVATLEKDYATLLPKDHAGKLQGALINIQPQTGYIRSLVGGRGYLDTQFNRVVQSQRQPGSIFKPFVYLTAFDPHRGEEVVAPTSYIYDVGFQVQSGGKPWTPHNYDKKEHGPVSVREALMKSYNIATARLAIDVGLNNVVKTARDAGIEADLQAVPALALGAFEVSPLEIASAYTIFANNGIRAEPLSLIHVVAADGTTLKRKSIEMKRRFDPGPVYLVTQVLKDVFNGGTASSARQMGFHGIAAGKTGTTNNYRDAWFVGFTPDQLTLTWVGYDDNATMNMSGARGALPMWVHYMREAVGDSQQEFPVPNNVVLVKIDPESGKAWTKRCPQSIFAPFVEGSEPTEHCPLH